MGGEARFFFFLPMGKHLGKHTHWWVAMGMWRVVPKDEGGRDVTKDKLAMREDVCVRLVCDLCARLVCDLCATCVCGLCASLAFADQKRVDGVRSREASRSIRGLADVAICDAIIQPRDHSVDEHEKRVEWSEDHRGEGRVDEAKEEARGAVIARPPVGDEDHPRDGPYELSDKVGDARDDTHPEGGDVRRVPVARRVRLRV